MSPSTIFRHFGTKEAIVVWDEHDAALDAALTERLASQRPFEALRDAFVDTLAARYQADLDFELDRVSLIYQTEALHAAAVEADFRDRNELTAALSGVLPKGWQHAAPLLAGAAQLALDVALDRWQQGQGRDDLGALVGEAFSTLESLGSLT